jgi:hypothetical protein
MRFSLRLSSWVYNAECDVTHGPAHRFAPTRSSAETRNLEPGTWNPKPETRNLTRPPCQLLARKHEHCHTKEAHTNEDREVAFVTHAVVVRTNEAGQIIAEEA